MSIASRLKGSNPSSQVSAYLAGSITTPSAKLSSTTFPVQYIVIAGGGSGGNGGGGAGAGGYRSSVTEEYSGRLSPAETPLTIYPSTNYTVTVGAGGTRPAVGANSVFSTVTSDGGGVGGYSVSTTTAGGSGGGWSGGGGGEGSGIAGQGFAGGSSCGDSGGGAGGGAGGPGGYCHYVPGRTGGQGGIGIFSSITGSSVERAGGGGGSAVGDHGTATGGGSRGTGYGTGTRYDATANTGGGGGGGDYSTSLSAACGNGGSGVVFLKYPDGKTITIGSGLTGSTAAASGGYKVTTITAGTGNVSWV